MNYEEKLLTYLVENYRKSKKDLGDNKTNRRTQVKPEKLYKKYNANDGNFEEISNLNQIVFDLVQKGFITCTEEKFGTQLKNIYLVDEKIEEIEEYISCKYGYVTKAVQVEKLQNIIERYKHSSYICTKECELLEESVKSRKIPKNIDELDNIFKAIAFIENNQSDLYIREVSMKVYGDSKFFEDNTLQQVCTILQKYFVSKNDKNNKNNKYNNNNRNKENKENNTENIDEPNCEFELADEILLNYHISKEPQKLAIKGNVTIGFLSKAEVDISAFENGIEFTVSDLESIEYVSVNANKFITIENKTSYLRFLRFLRYLKYSDSDKNTVIFYLGGYATRYQRDFIKLIYKTNPNIRYMHFGDIDAGGFLIHHNLCQITGINFELYCMSEKELKNNMYANCLHPLTDNDKIRLRELQEIGIYNKVINYMLKNNVKLEQEIISLNLSIE